MVTTFLHEDKPQSPDELTANKPPFCGQCGEEMWLTSVSKTIDDAGIEGIYTYECKHCGGRAKIRQHSDYADAQPIAPDLR